MSTIWRKIPGFVGCKYLVVRRDGTIPRWPWFVLGADDPSAPAALRAYADACEVESVKRVAPGLPAIDPAYIESVRGLAVEWANRPPAQADPDAPPHRVDNAYIVDMMIGNGDLAGYLPTDGDGFPLPVSGEAAASSGTPRYDYNKAIAAAAREYQSAVTTHDLSRGHFNYVAMKAAYDKLCWMIDAERCGWNPADYAPAS